MSNVDEYLETRVMTATPYQLHLMVVEGSIRHAKRALGALQERDIETAHQALNNCRNFVSELIGGLDRQQAPEIVDNLLRLFFFAYERLTLADLQHDSQMVEDALKVLLAHHDTWVTLGRQLQSESAASPRPKLHNPDEHESCSWSA